MSPVVSSTPGRLRLRHPALRHPARLQALERRLALWPEVRTLQANPATGSLVVHYDALALAQDACAQRCEAAVAGLLPLPAVEPRQGRAIPVMARAARTRAKRTNRLAKAGMLASLAASLLLAAAGLKRLHIWTGLLFLHALGAHLWVHRRHLLK